MNQYFLCPKCKKHLVKYSPEQFVCPKCRTIYGVAKKQQYTMRFINFVILAAMILGIAVGIINSFI
ncbi:hypothetical protein SAMN02910411_0113 [Pseudobutyrivibrio ruminis DSM 9787]|uniref:Uncharacterized protein n=1 Tax=Pseudobutyrivibrio ruminis DSM 9787 TaxID=1123011 RepID=A0A285T227_9FIRM|nr:hypothetical protein SAMN02910411_0113 [Pseudobutyrivibrio ruminis DSM 9787]